MDVAVPLTYAEIVSCHDRRLLQMFFALWEDQDFWDHRKDEESDNAPSSSSSDVEVYLNDHGLWRFTKRQKSIN
jgi:hypothetical protein